MRTDKEKALDIRLSGMSYTAISRDLGIPKSTLSGWFKNNPQSQAVFETLKEQHKSVSREKIFKMNEARQALIKTKEGWTKKEAEEQFQKLKNNPLFVAGICLYWGEGDQRTMYNVRISNTDPGIIALFRRFLVEIGGVYPEKVKSWLLLYPDLDEPSCKNYWAATAGLDSANFTKSIIIKGRHKTRKVPFGICTLGTGSRSLKIKMLIWIRLLAKEMVR